MFLLNLIVRIQEFCPCRELEEVIHSAPVITDRLCEELRASVGKI